MQIFCHVKFMAFFEQDASVQKIPAEILLFNKLLHALTKTIPFFIYIKE